MSMYAVFWTTTEPLGYVDHYEIVEFEEEAALRYERVLADPDLYCAGYGPISAGTEPQWQEDTYV